MSQTSQVAPKVPFYLKGNFAPIFEEFTDTKLEVIGEIPRELCGRFFRIGANPQSGTSEHWFLGDGMVHGVELKDGKANWYKNRYVRTPRFTNPELDSPDGIFDLNRSLANTHIVSHAGKILALEELHLPFEMAADLSTIGAYDFAGKLTTGMTAHPKICPETGEMLFFGYGVVPPYLTYHRVSKDGTLVQSEVIEVKGATMVHDFNVTKNYVIFMDLPFVYDLEKFDAGGIPLKFDESYGARLGVMPRKGSNADVTWYDIDPCYVFHPMNAYEDGDKIVIDVCRAGHNKDSGELDIPAFLHRWTIDQTRNQVQEQPLDDRSIEFPRIHSGHVGLKYRYGYTAGFDQSVGGSAVRLHKYDHETGKHQTYELPKGCEGSEPVFVAAINGATEDEGWIFNYVYNSETNLSEFVIIDAANFDAGPVARVPLPTRVPAGFHGSWIPDSSL